MKNSILAYIYYRMYRFQIAVGNGSVAVPMASLLMIFMLYINTASIIVSLLALIEVAISSELLTYAFIIIGAVIILAVYALSIHNKNYKFIIKRFKNEDTTTDKKGNMFVVIYIIFSIAFMGLSFYLILAKNNNML
ncbi:hypothetical protein [Hymenobacter algoricola]|uniref:Uncharacterized protein n=1 Tax=Hymenobacter algoricola TaxID=486267 RepID=A0ABP7NC18_9BACT